MTTSKFQEIVKNYYLLHGRDLPWRRIINPYRIVVSEVMLQQTQVSRVLVKYLEFIRQFPSWKRLADAPTADVIKAWQGLGYNRRALALKEIARRIATEYGGRVPKDAVILNTFPGIGPATANSICAFAFNQPTVFIETNIRRVYIHHFFPTKSRVADEELIPLIKKTLDKNNPRQWYWALMDYGSYLARQIENPNRRSKQYSKQSKFQGSRRQVRGQIIKLLTREHELSLHQIETQLAMYRSELKFILQQLIIEGFLIRKDSKFALA